MMMMQSFMTTVLASQRPVPLQRPTSSVIEQTLLHLAVADGDAEAARELLADAPPELIEAKDRSGFTALHYASFNGDLECVMTLLAAGASAEAPDASGLWPLHHACLHGHALVAYALLQGSDASPAMERQRCLTPGGCTPLMLASAAGDVDTVEALLAGGVQPDEKGSNGLSAMQLATAMGHDDVADFLKMHDADDGEEDARTIPPPRAPAPPAVVRTTTAEELAADRTIWTQAFAESVPLYVRGLGRTWSEDLAPCSTADLRRRWGEQPVDVVFSPDPHYQTLVSRPRPPARWMRETPSARMLFSAFIDLLPAHGGLEYFAVQQSPQPRLDAFDGLPAIPPLLERLMRNGQGAPSGASDDRLVCNLWVCAPPKRSQLHFDHYDSVLVQMKGTKRFTLIDPAPLDGLTVHPCRVPVAKLDRPAAGQYRYADEEDVGAAATSDVQPPRTYDNFPLANATHPDLAATPLMAHARTITVDVEEGDALVLPAYWYHEVDSLAGDGGLNIAINYWWNEGAAPATLHGALRERLRARVPSTPP